MNGEMWKVMEGVGMMASVVVVGVSMIILVIWKRLNSWLYEPTLKKGHTPLPPGDFGWPLLGNMPHFLFAFKSGNPQAFIGRYLSRYGRTGLYKALMFGQATVLATSVETCKAVLMAEDVMVTGWPTSTCTLMGPNSFTCLGRAEHHRLRRCTATSFNGHATLVAFLPTLHNFIIPALASWASASSPSSPIPLLPHLKKLTFHIIAKILIGFEYGERYDILEKAYKNLNLGMRAMAINLPGTAYNSALKSRKLLVKLLGQAIEERRKLMSFNKSRKWNDTMEALIVTQDEDGRVLSNDEIIDILLMYLNAGHESSAHSIMWILIYLKKYPQYFDKVKEEQMQIRKGKKENEELTYDDCRKMRYLSRVIDETLRIVNISPMVFRKSLEDVELNGYTIPKGWRVQTWLRQVHLDPEVYKDPLEFNPDRWENIVPKPGTFIPFGAGIHMCPGNEFAKLEMSVFMHYAILDYEFEPLTPNAPIVYLPHPRPKDDYLVHVYRKEPYNHNDKKFSQHSLLTQLKVNKHSF